MQTRSFSLAALNCHQPTAPPPSTYCFILISFSSFSLNTEGVKGFISYDVGAHNVMGTVSLDKNVNGSDLQLKAIYKHVGDVFVLEETWRFDSKNKLAGSYNFATEEANFAYTYSSGDYSATARYNFQSDESSLEVTKRDGKNSYSASYCPNKEDAMISWSAKPYKVTFLCLALCK